MSTPVRSAVECQAHSMGVRVLPIEPASPIMGARPPKLKRIFDIVGASLLLLLAAPFGAVIALAIWLETGGPVFFAHTRVGRGRRRFRLLKFRTMVQEADQVLLVHLREHPEQAMEWRLRHKLKNDPRVTRVGRLLRRMSLDELPQFLNVLRGNMSLVGPRPIVEDEIPLYGPAFRLYSRVQPGLTGAWQVSGRSDVSYKKRVSLDSDYIRHWTFWTDLRIILLTPRAVLRARGAC